MGVKMESKCWKCANATDGRKCEWARFFIPVQGWVAFPRRVQVNDGEIHYLDSYCVVECPKFVHDGDANPHWDWNETTNEAFEGLIRDIIIRAIKDWKLADKYERTGKNSFENGVSKIEIESMKADVERFLLGEWFKEICDLDGAVIVKVLRNGKPTKEYRATIKKGEKK